MQAIILAAGDGTRLVDHQMRPKVLVEVAGLSLLERSLATFYDLGIREFAVVTGYRHEQIAEFVARRRLDRRYAITLVHNPRWQEGNAYSVFAARGLVKDRFMVAMGDHLYDPRLLRGLLRVRGDFVGVFDSAPSHIDLAEATKARSHRGHVRKVSRRLRAFQYADAGLFICSERIFPVIEKCLAEGKDTWNSVKREWVKGHDLHIYDLAGGFWLEIDTPQDLERAEELLLERLGKPRDGVVSRNLNRRVSRPLSRFLVRTPVTPNQVSLLAFILGLFSALLFATGEYLTLALAGLFAQASSILDGSDGELARLRGTSSRFGGWMDAILDRVVDAAILYGMAAGLALRSGETWPWGLGFLAIVGSFLISYSESRYETAFNRPLNGSQFEFPAKRDSRLFLVMLGGILNQIGLALWAIALLSIAEVIRRLLTPLRRGSSL
ncbi:MAG: NTP transferase domain-containing protein [Chloroflexi bacterium]|nr:NTP transferase domain-containing protein [Chloroflexota bacterium]